MKTELSKQEIKELITSERPVILDIGAYDGKDGRELGAMFPKCEVHCFEPITEIKPFVNGVIHGVAVGSENSIVSFYGSPHAQSNSMREPKEHFDLFPGIRFPYTIYAQCVTLDSFLPSHYKTIDFIWCDVNGSEGDVIKGATETLKKTKYLYIEFSEKELYKGQVKKDELLAMLPDWELMGIYNYMGNFGNLLLKNTNYGKL